MNRIILALLIISSLKCSIITAQDKVYIYFDASSAEMCDIPIYQQGRYHGEKHVKKYRKIKSLNSELPDQFIICNELFILNNEKEICSIDYLKKIKFSQIEKLLQKIDEINPLYPDKVFDKTYLVEKINHKKIAIYDVKWQYYIE